MGFICSHVSHICAEMPLPRGHRGIFSCSHKPMDHLSYVRNFLLSSVVRANRTYQCFFIIMWRKGSFMKCWVRFLGSQREMMMYETLFMPAPLAVQANEPTSRMEAGCNFVLMRSWPEHWCSSRSQGESEWTTFCVNWSMEGPPMGCFFREVVRFCRPYRNSIVRTDLRSLNTKCHSVALLSADSPFYFHEPVIARRNDAEVGIKHMFPPRAAFRWR